MTTILQCATYFFSRYYFENGNLMDEMKLHKLIYFAQRESFIRHDRVLFPESMFAWRFGPVAKEIRSESLSTVQSNLLKQSFHVLDPDDNATLDFVYTTYSNKDSWSLSRLTHGEISWKKARLGYSDYENSDVQIKNEDIREDAQRIKLRRKLLRYAN